MKAIVLNPPRRRRSRRRNYWKGEPERHRRAARKGWRKRRSKSKTRSFWPFLKARARSEKAAARRKSRRSRRGRKRFDLSKYRSVGVLRRASNYWPDNQEGHSRAARKGWGRRWKASGVKRRAKSHIKKARKGGRRRAANAHGGGTWIPEFKNPYWTPTYARNPAKALSVGGMIGQVQAVAPMAVGAVANGVLSGLSSRFLPVDAIKQGWGNVAWSGLMAGVTGMIAGMINRRWAAPVALGALTDTLVRSSKMVLEQTGVSGYLDCVDCMSPDPSGMGDLGDFLSVADSQRAMPLGLYPGDEVIERTAASELALA